MSRTKSPTVANSSTSPIWVAELELSRSLEPVGVSRPLQPDDSSARVLVRLHDRLVGFVSIPVSQGEVSGSAVSAAIQAQLAESLRRHHEAGAPGASESLTDELASVVVCTRDRPQILANCLKLLQQLRHGNFEVVVVDNAPSSDATRACFERMVGEDSRFRYVREMAAGLSCARNRGLREAKGRVVAFTDDDVQVDPLWLREIAAGFSQDPKTGCVTGIVPPAQLDDYAQQFFDRRYTWADHVDGRVFDLVDNRDDSPLYPYSAGVFGTGANFAIDRELFIGLGGFDEALGAGTPAGGGEDLDAFVRVLRAGRSIVYRPSAIVWHVHRSDDAALRRQLFYYGVGLTAFLTKHLLDVRTAAAILSRLPRGVGRLRRSWSPDAIGAAAPKKLVLVELAGMLAGPLAYLRGRRRSRRT